MNLHAAPPPFGKWGPRTRFATARDIAIIALCLLIIVGFIAQTVGGAPRRVEPLAAAPAAAGAPA